LQRHRLTTWAPIFIASMAFALAHAGHGPAPIPIFFFSLALGYAYEKTGRLAPSIIAHLMLNLTTSIMLWLMISGRIPAE
jgi:membrane protease YdiL (CAAX protease family)